MAQSDWNPCIWDPTAESESDSDIDIMVDEGGEDIKGRTREIYGLFQ